MNPPPLPEQREQRIDGPKPIRWPWRLTIVGAFVLAALIVWLDDRLDDVEMRAMDATEAAEEARDEARSVASELEDVKKDVEEIEPAVRDVESKVDEHWQ